MALPPTVGMGVSGTGREGDGGMSREFFVLKGVDGKSSSDE
jgi:hypothetical protein